MSIIPKYKLGLHVKGNENHNQSLIVPWGDG